VCWEVRLSNGALEIVALGGVGEFGMNMLAISHGESTLVIDAGAMFPGPELLGVDLIVPDLTYLQNRRVDALVLTHGHEDHIGGVPYVWPLLAGPVYGTRLTTALVEPKLAEHRIDPGDRLRTVAPGDRVRVGPFEVEFIRVTHSMPDCVAVALHTPLGTVVHTGDFKVDQTPIDGEHFDLHRFALLGSEGVLALLADSTNVDRRGVTGSEFEVLGAFEEIFTSAAGLLVVTTFASSLYRIQLLLRLAERFGRRVALVGRGMVENAQIAQRLGHLRVPEGLLIRDSEVPNLPRDRVLCITTGSQGEPRSALSRIAVDDHRHVTVGPGDTVVFSARAIPGNEKAIGRVVNHLTRRGAQVITEAHKHVHVSGHGSEEELKLVHSLVRPRYLVPIHGEYRQLAEHRRVARQMAEGTGRPVDVRLIETGDILEIGPEGAEVVGRAPTGRVLIDDTRTGEVPDEVLRDRRHLAVDGFVLPVVAIRRQDGELAGAPEIITRGVVDDATRDALVADGVRLVTEIAAALTVEQRTDPGLLREAIQVELRRFFKRRSGRRPLVLPVVMEI
jgi:ribonuclease J